MDPDTGGHDPAVADDGIEAVLGLAADVVTALTTAWTIYKLYPNPIQQSAFQRAVTTLAENHDPSLVLEVAASGLLCEGRVVEVDRDAVARLTTSLYVHDVELFGFRSIPEAQNLADFFELLERDDQEVRTAGGFARLMGNEGTSSLWVKLRGLLGSRDDGEGGPGDHDDEGTGNAYHRRTELAKLIDDGASPEEVAAALNALAAGSMDSLAAEFVDAFVEIHDEDQGQTAPRRFNRAEWLMPYWKEPAPPPPIEVFLDAFFRLEGEPRIAIMAAFLPKLNNGIHRMFLDQLSGDELAALAPALPDRSFSELVRYAREVVDTTEGETDDVLSLLHSSRDVKHHRRAAAARVADMLMLMAELETTGDALHQIREQLAADQRTDIGLEVLRGLFECERRDHRFARLTRVWTGRIATHVRQADFTAALATLRAIRDDPPYPSARALQVAEALEALLTGRMLDSLVETFDAAEDGDDAAVFVQELGTAAVNKLIETMADEKSATRRRKLTRIMAAVAQSRPDVIAGRMTDDRWFVVRNLAAALGASGHADAAEPLTRAFGHEDERVRIEAMRALVPILKDDATPLLIEALHDRHPKVRFAAIALLARSEAPNLEQQLIVALASEIDVKAKEGVARILAESESPEAQKALKKFAGRSLALRSDKRTARAAARSALKEAS